MQKTEIVCGLPWLQSKPERAIFLELGFACVYAVGPIGGRPLRISWARQLKDKLAELQPGSWEHLQVHEALWTAGDMLAVRVLTEAAAILDKGKRRLFGDWYDVTPVLAHEVLRIASEKSRVPTFTHTEMLDKVRTIRKQRIEAAVRNA
ncbi:hypothetical protein [Bradyrhizobium sp. SZCCHNS3053]|uniref:hypothetical protein n=1 Tax=Bradyrhizobium sp. SZCCHNS3053 TaxID=3057322 RepID=UPI0029161578|nr:hypothetical protein [Bradyrhizobium sp. SZCCHNS3053]